jgi:hypothetical protein
MKSWLRDKIARFTQSQEAFVLGESRVTVLDVDLTGVDARKDSATGIAIRPLAGASFRLADLRYCPLMQDVQGKNSDSCYGALLDVLGSDPIITFNPNFVRHMLERSLTALGLPLPLVQWLDLGQALEGAFGKDMGQVGSMQAWQQRLKVDRVREHAASADVFTMAQLFEILVARCEEMELRTLDELMQAQKNETWLRGG